MIALYIILGFVIIVVIPHLLVSFLLFMRFFYRQNYEKSEKEFFENEDYKAYFDLIKSGRKELENREHKEVKIKSFDKLNLYADYYPNKGNKIVLMVHGFKTVPNINFAYISNIFYEKGYSLLIVDQRCHHRSEGKFITYGSKESKDVIAWVEYVKNDLNYKDIYLYGISMGAASIALASPYLDVNYIVLDSCYNSKEGLVEHLCPKNVLFKYFVLPFANMYARMFIGLKNKDCNVSNTLVNNKNPLLFIHGDVDRITPMYFLEQNFEKAGGKKDIMVIAGAPHGMPLLEGKEEAKTKLFNYLEK